MIRVVTLVGLAVWALGCGAAKMGPARYHYFEPPNPMDPWSAPIAEWQQRARASTGKPEGTRVPSPVSAARKSMDPPPSPTSPLAGAYARFRTDRRRTLASEVVAWVQTQAQSHFVPDSYIDRWPTFEEVLQSKGDDCDGLALLAYHMLSDLGFAPGKLFEAIVRRVPSGEHHMVTFWFEDPDDPWVIDPTGAMVSELVRMSSVPDWHPVKIFNVSEEYSVRMDDVLSALRRQPAQSGFARR